MRNLKSKVKACENIFGTHIAFNYPPITELYGYVGFDFVWIDTEHAPLSYEDTLNHISRCHLSDTAAIVRVGQRDRDQLKRIMEMGPDGIIFPMVNTPEEAEAAISCTLYPPKGTRGFGPLGAVKYGMRPVDDYIAKVDEETCRFIQIESETAVRNLPKLIENPYIDGYIIGPCDLSGSIGELNNIYGDRNIALIKEAIAIVRGANKTIGLSTGSADPAVTKFWHDLGINMLSTGVDFEYIRQGAMANLKFLRTLD